MNEAIKQAKMAFLIDEVPIGAVLVDNKTEKIINSSHNLVNFKKNATAHAEMNIINKVCQKEQKKLLKNTSLFITLEPCAMCAAAISEVQIQRIYFGAYDEKKGSLESIMKIYNKKNFFLPEIYGGIKEKECSLILKEFFITKRNK
tara:strand:- start:565 stop:1002 length:438 start_codon:yes stop_codon:yes gene_type:complete